MKKLLLPLFVICLMSSCSTIKVSFPTTHNEKVDRIVLLSTYIDIQKPVFPLIDAAVINGKTNSISDEITSMFMDNVSLKREKIAQLLIEKLNCEVIFGEKLHQLSNFEDTKTTFNVDDALIKKDDHFPEIASDLNDMHPFKFDNGKVTSFFKTPDNYKSIVAGICNKLNVNHIAVSYTVLLTTPGSIYYRSKVGNYTYLYLFNKNGDCIASGSNITPAIPFKAGEVEGYQLSLDQQSATILPVIEKIAAKFAN